jgi:parvulin-like peptidyl-prolyl isomerase
MRIGFLLITALTALFFAACTTEKPKSESKPIVQINGDVYTAENLWDFASMVIWEIAPKDLDNPQINEQLLSDFVEHKLLLIEAERRGITADQDQLDQLYLLLDNPDAAKELKAITGHYNVDSRKVAQLMSERMIINNLLTNVVVSTVVSDSELKRFYDTRGYGRSPTTGRAHILHIFTTDNETARKAARELASGIHFEEVARKYSEGPEQATGGDLGIVVESEFPEFFSPAFRLKEGETSAVIPSDYGYHIFKMVQFVKASNNSFENIKLRLLTDLYMQKRQAAVTDFIGALQNNAEIKYLSNFTLSERYTYSN